MILVNTVFTKKTTECCYFERMEFADYYKYGLDALKYAVLPIAYWLWSMDRRLRASEDKIKDFDLTSLKVTLAKIEKDLVHIRETTDRLDKEQTRQREYLRQQ